MGFLGRVSHREPFIDGGRYDSEIITSLLLYSSE